MKPERIAFITVCLCLISPAPVSRASESEAGNDRSRDALAAPQQGAERAGVQRIRLADYGLKLETGVDYHWFISIIEDAEQRAHERIAGGAIARIDVPADLVPKLATAGAAQRPFVLAEGGIWYDAVDVLSRRIAAAPGDTGLRGQRAALLEQVGLEEAARAERAIAAGEPGSAAPAGRIPAGLSSDEQQR